MRLITRKVNLDFSNSAVAQGYLSVPFKVGKIKTLCVAYTDTSATPSADIILMSSNLVRDEPIAVFNRDFEYMVNNETFVFTSQNPLDINGTFFFNVQDIGGSEIALDGLAIVVLQFEEAEE